MSRLYRDKMKSIIAIVLLVIFTASCASIFKGNHSRVEFNSEPDGAAVYVNGNRMGTTPLRLKLLSDQEYTIEFKIPGYKSVIRHISSKVGAGWVILDVLGGLLPVVVDAATGSWYELDQKYIDVILDKQQPRS